MLLIDAFAIGKPPIDIVTTNVPPLSQSQIQQYDEEVAETSEVVILPYWHYKHWQPVRNIVRYFHNKKLKDHYCCW
jgi:predicted metallo-beta-lactamase superfamily hydrolase